MIPQDAYDHWREVVPWTSPHEVEQDLVITRLICEISQHSVLGEALALKGGTCLHKVWLPSPWRYSEDLDYTVLRGTPVDEIKKSIKEIGDRSGFSDLNTRMGQGERSAYHARLLGSFRDGRPMSIKVDLERNADEPALPYTRRPFSVHSTWFQSDAEVLSYEPAEMLASKVAALYGRRKHRDLFDIWAAMQAGLVSERAVAECFGRYRPDEWTARLAANNLRAKLARTEYIEQLKEDAAYLQQPYDLADNVRTAARLIDACTEASQPSKRWRRVLSAQATAMDSLGGWKEPLHASSGAAEQDTSAQGLDGGALMGAREHDARQPLRPSIVQCLKGHPNASYADIAQTLNASSSYVAEIARKEGLTRQGRRDARPKR